MMVLNHYELEFHSDTDEILHFLLFNCDKISRCYFIINQYQSTKRVTILWEVLFKYHTYILCPFMGHYWNLGA